MGKMLVLCERRSIADAISRALGGSFVSEPTQFEGRAHVITWAGGEIAGLADPEHYDPSLATWRIEDLPIVPEQFEVVARAESEPAKAQLKAIRALVRRSDSTRLVNACAPGREGELTFAYIRELVQAGDLPVERAWLSSLSRAAICQAFARLRPAGEQYPREAAARSRDEAEWLIGVNGSRAATVRARALGGRIEVGRVLTPTLAMLVRREREIEAFAPGSNHEVEAAFETGSGSARYLGRWMGAGEAATAAAVADRVRGAVACVRTFRHSEAPRRAPLLYDLVTLQRQAAQWLGFTPRRTLDAAQECYERAVLSYPGTASRYLPRELAGELREITTHVGRARAAYREPAGHVEALAELPLARVVDDAKVGDQHALIPTNAAHVLSALGDDARSIYDLVARRFLAAFLPPATFDDTIVVTRIERDWFLSQARVPRDPGWYAAYDAPLREQAMTGAGATDRELPELSEGMEVRCVRAEIRHSAASPRAYLDDASLLTAMLGATDATAIERLVEVGYVVRDGSALRPTPKGVQVIDLLEGHAITSPELLLPFTRRLLQMERGGEPREDFMRDMESFTRELVEHLRELPEERTHFPRRDLGIVCPRCGEGALIENRKGFGCSTWTSREAPGCGFVVWKSIAGRQITEEIVRELVAKGRTGELTGFRSRAGRAFSAALVLEPTAEQPVAFSFKPRRGATGRTRA
jgi:DNA topoisomerase-3